MPTASPWWRSGTQQRTAELDSKNRALAAENDEQDELIADLERRLSALEE